MAPAALIELVDVISCYLPMTFGVTIGTTFIFPKGISVLSDTLLTVVHAALPRSV
jgi:hypothetical protein